MRFLTRREFLNDSAIWTAALAATAPLAQLATAADPVKPVSANDRLKVAVLGVHGRGRDHLKGLAGQHGCIVATVCDVDANLADDTIKYTESLQKEAPKFEQDLRKVLDDKTIDIITIATPNHWHSLAAIWAIQAGKDVYVEKPVSHNVTEGRRLVEIVGKSKQICQAGTQSRSMNGMREAIEYVQSGKIGKVSVARGLCYKLRGSIGKVKAETPIPKGIDYDLWCGPAPKKPLMRSKLHYDWHWTWDYGNGDLGNQGIHEMDKARWGLGKTELPKSVLSIGGRFGYVDDGETANTQICVFDYGDAELIFEVRGLPTTGPLPQHTKRENWVGNIFYGTEGMVVCPSYDSGVVMSPKGEVLQTFKGGGDHYGNFVAAVRSRKADTLRAPIIEGHISSALCHLGNISYRLGTPYDGKTKAFGDDKQAADTVARMEEHLKDNKVALDDPKYHVGRRLTIDPKAEKFVNDQEADALLTREYRKGFEVPDKA